MLTLPKVWVIPDDPNLPPAVPFEYKYVHNLRPSDVTQAANNHAKEGYSVITTGVFSDDSVGLLMVRQKR